MSARDEVTEVPRMKDIRVFANPVKYSGYALAVRQLLHSVNEALLVVQDDMIRPILFRKLRFRRCRSRTNNIRTQSLADLQADNGDDEYDISSHDPPSRRGIGETHRLQ